LHRESIFLTEGGSRHAENDNAEAAVGQKPREVDEKSFAKTFRIGQRSTDNPEATYKRKKTKNGFISEQIKSRTKPT
jgi:hypothetical protein